MKTLNLELLKNYEEASEAQAQAEKQIKDLEEEKNQLLTQVQSETLDVQNPMDLNMSLVVTDTPKMQVVSKQ